MNKFIAFIVMCFVPITSYASRWDAVVQITGPGQEIDANALLGDTLLIVDASLGFAGLRLHECTEIEGFKFVGLSKIDPTSNPVIIRMDSGVSVGGYSTLALVERDDIVVLGCGGGRWFLESRSEAVGREDAVNRTILASNINPRIINAEVDRSGIERVVANTDVPAVVILPTMDHCSGLFNGVVGPGYACTYDIKIYRVGQNSISQVHIYPPTGRSFENDSAPKKLCLPDQTIDFHYDGAQWRVQNKYPDDVARGVPCE